MDNIVFGISRLSFGQNLWEIKENCAPNLIKESSGEMSSFDDNLCIITQNEDKGGNLYTPDSSILNGSDWEEEMEDDDNSNQNIGSRKGYLFPQRRKMPSRTSKEFSLSGIKRRTIIKPSKYSQTIQGDVNSLKPADIKKIYLNKKLTNFRPSSLETIFEEESCNEHAGQSSSRLMSVRKIRRTLSFSDGQRYTKSLVKKRRIKIKKTFGKRFALKKISLEEFIEKFNNSIEESGESKHTNIQIETDDDKDMHKKANTSQSLEMSSNDKFISNIGTVLTNTPSDAITPISFCTDSSL